MERIKEYDILYKELQGSVPSDFVLTDEYPYISIEFPLIEYIPTQRGLIQQKSESKKETIQVHFGGRGMVYNEENEEQSTPIEFIFIEHNDEPLWNMVWCPDNEHFENHIDDIINHIKQVMHLINEQNSAIPGMHVEFVKY